MKTSPIDWDNISSIHFVGIKGVAMTALAVWAKESGFSVSGSDTTEQFPTDDILEQKGIAVSDGFSPVHVKGDLLIYTGAHGGRKNIEVEEGIKRGIPVISQGKALGAAMNAKKRLSTAGCHGKTTTTAMIATILTHANADPSYAIGSGMVSGLGYPGHAGKGDWFVAEADEYVTEPYTDMTPRFLWQQPHILVITNVDFDHPDVYKNLEDVKHAYTRLVESTEGEKIVIINADDEHTMACLPQTGFLYLTFGITVKADFRIIKQTFVEGNNSFCLEHKSKVYGPFVLRIPGEQNISNAAAAIIACHSVGVSWEDIAEGLEHFGGVKRRFERIGMFQGALCFDDYAHHPTEIAATIASAKQWYPKSNIHIVFQPHTYSRTQSLLSDFGKAFGSDTNVYILPIYASAREKNEQTQPIQLVQEIAKYNHTVKEKETLPGVFDSLSTEVNSNDIVIVMGAGDIGRLASAYLKEHNE